MFSKLVLFSLTTVLLGHAVNAQTFSGDGTWFHPALGSCGQFNTDNDFIVAMNAPQYDAANPCGRRIRVNYQGRSVDVTVVDRCAGCLFGSVDLSPAAFQVLSDLSVGRIHGVTWNYI